MRAARLIRRTPRWYRPHVLPLEDRLPLGEAVMGLLAGAALLPAHPGPAAQYTPQPAGQPVALAPGSATAVRGPTLPARTEDAPTGAFADEASAAVPAPAWRALTDLFAASPRPSARPSLFGAAEPRPGLLPAEPTPAPQVGAPLVSRTPAAAAPDSEDRLLATLTALQAPAPPAGSTVTPAQHAQVKEGFGKLPLYFEQNVGQTDPSVHFFARGPGYGLFLTSTEAVMVLQQPREAAHADAHGLQPVGVPGRESIPAATDAEPPAVVRMHLVGANATPTVTGLEEQPGKVNYFLGSDPAQWHTNIATFGKVQYADVYPGIDLVWYGTNRQMEYDFVVSPGADPTAIRLNVRGAERLELDAAGDLVVTAGGQQLRQHKPFVYQAVGGMRQEVASRFVLEGQQVRFDVAAYDAGRPLVIDPVLSYSTYLGGSFRDYGTGIAVDPATGDVLITGTTSSTDFPTANPLQGNNRGFQDVFVTRLNAAGSALVYSTYLGGSFDDRGHALAVDPASGDALVTGGTGSTNFPTANPLQAANRGADDVFVTRLNAAGSALVWSTYLGGGDLDEGDALAVDPATGDALVTGYTFSTNFPTANPLQATHGGGFEDVFVARLNAVGSALVFSTYLGGSNEDVGSGIAVDPATGDALVTGSTWSRDFPTANPLQATHGGGDFDVFVTRLSANGSALVFSTYLGGSDDDFGHALAVDPATGDALVTGNTWSTDFPTANPLQASNRGNGDVFVTRLNAAGSALVFSTYLGGSNNDWGHGLAVDPASGDALVTGLTESTNFPTANPLQASNRGFYDVFVARLNAAGRALVYSTYLGGSGNDFGYALAVDPATGDALVTGSTYSPDFPTTPGAFDRTCGTDGNCNGVYDPKTKTWTYFSDTFVTRIGSPPVAFYYIYPGTEGGVSVPRGEVHYVYILPFDANFNWITDYRGTVTFYSPDPLSWYTPTYTFTGTEGGIGIGAVIFGTLGPQELYVWNPPVTVFGYAVYNVV